MANHVEVPEWLNRTTVEKAYARAKAAAERHDDRYAAAGLRAARARDAKLLLVLDKGSEIIHAMMEEQTGRTRRSSDIEGLKVELTEFQMWRNAYTLCDQGADRTAMHPYAHIYAAAVLLAGLVF